MKEIQKIRIPFAKHATAPTPKAIEQARSVQSQLDKVEHQKHIERQRRDLTSVGTANQFVNDIDFSKALPQIKAQTKPLEQMTMSELSKQAFFDTTEKVSTDTTMLESVNQPDTAKFIPLKDVVYQVQNPDGNYWLKWDSKLKGVLFCSYADMSIKKLILSCNTTGLPFIRDITELSFGRYTDIVNSKPSVAKLFQAGYKWLELERQEFNKATFDILSAVPLF